MNIEQMKKWAKGHEDPVEVVEKVIRQHSRTRSMIRDFPSHDELKELLEELIDEEILIGHTSED